MQSLPKFIQREIFLECDRLTLSQVNRINKKFNGMIQDQEFWRIKVEREFPERPRPLNCNLDWKMIYGLYTRYEEILSKFKFVEYEDYKGEWGGCMCEFNVGWPFERLWACMVTVGRSMGKQEFGTTCCGGKVIGIHFYGTFDDGDTLYFQMAIRNSGFQLMVKRGAPYELIRKLRNQFKTLISLTEPTYSEYWTPLDEYFNEISWEGKDLQPYWYFFKSENSIIYKSLQHVLDLPSTESLYYESLFRNQPEILLNVHYKIQGSTVRVFDKEAKIGHYYGTPFIVYHSIQGLVLRVALENVKELIQELERVLK